MSAKQKAKKYLELDYVTLYDAKKAKDIIRGLLKELEATEQQLETERLRLAACGTAALGYFDGCNDEYKSASLGDVLRLKERAETTERKLAEAEKLTEEIMLRVEKTADNSFQDKTARWIYTRLFNLTRAKKLKTILSDYEASKENPYE